MLPSTIQVPRRCPRAIHLFRALHVSLQQRTLDRAPTFAVVPTLEVGIAVITGETVTHWYNNSESSSISSAAQVAVTGLHLYCGT